MWDCVICPATYLCDYRRIQKRKEDAQVKYLVSSMIDVITFFGIALGLYVLYLFDKLPEVLFVVCLVALEVVFLYAISLTTTNNQIGEKQ